MSTPANQQQADLDYIRSVLLMEFQHRLANWNVEYTQPRDLGVRGEFVGLYRKARKLKSILWDGHDPSAWREGTRTMLMEIAAHAFLAIRDIDLQEEQGQDQESDKEDGRDAEPMTFHRPDETKWLVTVPRRWLVERLNVERIEDSDVPF